MTSVTKQAGNTLVSMLATVNVTANTVTRTVHTAASALDMLDQYVQDARREQVARSIFNEASMLTRIREDAASEAAQRRTDLIRKFGSDPELQAQFDKAYAETEETAKTVALKLQHLTNRSALIEG